MSTPLCSICTSSPSKYRCPRCDVRTCSIACVRAHKEGSGCSGLRDKTAYVDMASYDDNKLISDYVYLEETSRTITRAAKNPIIHKPSFSLSDDAPSAPRRGSSGRPRLPRAHARLRALQGAARREGVELRIMPDGMTRRVTNKTTVARLPPVSNVVPTTSGNDDAATTRGDVDEPEE
ncbi:Box C/D snoRNA protein 1, partial [Gonapodya sp. JEL0774]